jgi:hypothetical protein
MISAGGNERESRIWILATLPLATLGRKEFTNISNESPRVWSRFGSAEEGISDRIYPSVLACKYELSPSRLFHPYSTIHRRDAEIAS